MHTVKLIGLVILMFFAAPLFMTPELQRAMDEHRQRYQRAMGAGA